MRNDVWIGYEELVRPGVSIGTGRVVELGRRRVGRLAWADYGVTPPSPGFVNVDGDGTVDLLVCPARA